MSKKKGKRRGKGVKRRKVKKVLDENLAAEFFGVKSAAVLACRNCWDQANVLCMVDYGAYNFDAFARNRILVTCPICATESAYENADGYLPWIAMHIRATRDKFVASTNEIRWPQDDDHEKFVRNNPHG